MIFNNYQKFYNNKMSNIKSKYDYKKNILLIIFGIIMLVFFTYLYLNSNELSLRKPGIGRYSWVGELFYKNNKLLSVVSIFFIFLFVYSLVILITQLFKNKCSRKSR